MSDVEYVLLCMLVVVAFVCVYIAGKGNLIALACEMLVEEANKFDKAMSEKKEYADGWISLEKDCPEECQWVIVWDSLNNRISIAYYSPPHWVGYNYDRLDVLAWMPLPPDYIQKEDKQK